MKTVTAVEMQRRFGKLREEAQRGPVGITNHGRESLVLLSAEEYRRLKSLDRVAQYAWETPADEVDRIAETEPSAAADKLNDLLD